MAKEQRESDGKAGVSKLQLAIGAASLFLFIVGLKRTFRVDDGKGTRTTFEDRSPSEAEPRSSGSRGG